MVYESSLYAARFTDREDIFAYLDRHAPRMAHDVKTLIKQRIESLGHNPKRSRLIRELGVHAHWLGRYPYIIYYRIVNDEVFIVHIRHAAREPWQGQ